MPIIVRYDNPANSLDSTGQMVGGFAQGFGASLDELARQQRQDQILNRQADIRRQEMAYQQQLHEQSQADAENRRNAYTAMERKRRSEAIGPILDQMQATAPAHIDPALFKLGHEHFVEHGTLPPMFLELAGAKTQQQYDTLKAKQEADQAKADSTAAEADLFDSAYRARKGQGYDFENDAPFQLAKKGLATGRLKSDSPMIRNMIGATTASEDQAATREGNLQAQRQAVADRALANAGTRLTADQRLRKDRADALVRETSAGLLQALRDVMHPERVKDAEEMATQARQHRDETYAAIQRELGQGGAVGPGVVPPPSGTSPDTPSPFDGGIGPDGLTDQERATLNRGRGGGMAPGAGVMRPPVNQPRTAEDEAGDFLPPSLARQAPRMTAPALQQQGGHLVLPNGQPVPEGIRQRALQILKQSRVQPDNHEEAIKMANQVIGDLMQQIGR